MAAPLRLEAHAYKRVARARSRVRFRRDRRSGRVRCRQVNGASNASSQPENPSMKDILPSRACPKGPSRRQLLLAAAGVTATPALTACSSGEAEQSAARSLRLPQVQAAGTADSPISPISPISPVSPMHDLVRQATLAPSSHNTQCWRFQIAEKSISIAPDLTRRCPAVDPDDHHLYVSLGCAAENIVHAALATGLHSDPQFDPGGDGVIAVNLEATQQRITPLSQAISERQCTRGDYDGQPVSPAELSRLEQAGTGDGVSVRLLTARPAMESVLEVVVAANTVQMNDPAFVTELKSWIRFSADEALRTGDGLYAGVTGNPALPRWLGSRVMGLFFKQKSEGERYARQIRNSAGLAVFFSERNDKAHWVEAGRCYERFALQATALGIRNALLNQPVEVGAVRPQFAAWLGLASHQRPDLVVRFGRGPAMPWSMRRPLPAVLV
ncbi:MAG: Tat pathway signal protein [Rubrivivax sp.]